MKKNIKSNTKRIIQSLNLKLAIQITIQFSESSSNFVMEESLLFKVYLKSFLIGKSLSMGKEKYEINVFNKNMNFIIINANFITENSDSNKEIPNEESFIINEETSIEIEKNVMNGLTNDFEQKLNLDNNEENIIKNILENKKNFLYSLDESEEVTLIGFTEEFKKIQKIIQYSLQGKYMDIISNPVQADNQQSLSNCYLYKCVMVSGASGIGKSNLIKFIVKSHKSEVNFFQIDLLNDIILYKDSESSKIEDKIKNTFKFAKMLSPSVIVFEDIDRLFNKSEEEDSSSVLQLNDRKTKLLFCLLNEIDSLKINDKVLLLSTCTSVDRLLGDLRKCGRFDCVLTLSAPNQIQRKKYLEHFAKNFNNKLLEEDFEVLADKSHGFVGGDIIQVFKDAILQCENKSISRRELETSLKNIKPINLKDIILDIPKVLWSDIGGNKDLIKKIRQSIEWPLKNPEAFKRIGITPPNGILLYGPPGCSKTMIAKALATESGLNFFAVKGPELFSKYVGDTEKAVRDIFKKAKMSSPSIIFFDEIDSMANQRGSDSVVSDKVLCQLLNEMDGIEGRERVVIFGATNRPDILDKALIRPGRFDRLIYIPPPDIEARKEIFRINLKKMSVDEDVNIEELLELTIGFSGAEINLSCREAGMLALDEDINAKNIKQRHLEHSIKQIKPIINREMLDYFENFAKNVEL